MQGIPFKFAERKGRENDNGSDVAGDGKQTPIESAEGRDVERGSAPALSDPE
jgi:hypothetical protein